MNRIRRRGSLLEKDISKGESRLEQRKGLGIKGPRPNKGWGRVISVGDWLLGHLHSAVFLGPALVMRFYMRQHVPHASLAY